jgi:hypothetical protein
MHRATSVYEPIPPNNSSSRHRQPGAVHGGGEARVPGLQGTDELPADRGARLNADPLGLLLERASTLAARARDGSLPFLDAVDMAYSAADMAGLVDRFGDDVVQAVLADAFGGRP